MAPARSGSVVYGTAYPSRQRVAPRLWLITVATIAVVGVLALLVGFERSDARAAVPLFQVSRDVAEPAVAMPMGIAKQAPPVAADGVVVEPPPAPVQTVSLPAGPQFNGMAVRPVKTMRMLVTAYCPCRQCCGRHADGITASGYSVWVNGGKMVAADTRVLPFGSLLSIPGYHDAEIVPVLDRGGKIKGHRLDVLFPTHRQAKRFGKRWVDVQVYALDD